MKKLILPLLAAITIAGCASQVKLVETTVNFNLTDFREYSERGFLVTPEAPVGDYDPVGFVEVIVNQGAVLANQYAGKGLDGEKMYRSVWVHEKIFFKTAIDSLVSYSESIGADALTHFKTEATYRTPDLGPIDPTLLELKVSAFAISRKSK
jgi:hypothetical protein